MISLVIFFVKCLKDTIKDPESMDKVAWTKNVAYTLWHMH